MLTLTVGPEGEYHTIGEALQAVPYGEEALIRISEGVYREKLFFEKRRITLCGAGAGRTVITWNDGAKDLLPDGTKRGTFRSYTLFAGGEAVCLRDLTVENSAGPGNVAGQGLAVYADADRVFMERVSLSGYQDTLFCAPLPQSVRQPGGFFGPRHLCERKLTKQYYRDCEITGDIDFIFGGADAVFEGCRITVRNRDAELCKPDVFHEEQPDSKPRINGYIAAPCESRGELGLAFVNCHIRGEEGIREGSVFLGRPWRPEGKAVYIDCTFDESIHPRRFSEWGRIEAESSEAFFGEYGSLSEKGEKLSLSGRNPWVRVLTDDEAAKTGSLIRRIREEGDLQTCS